MLLNPALSRAQVGGKPLRLELPGCLAIDIGPVVSPKTSEARLDSIQRIRDSVLTAEIRRAFPTRIRLLLGGLVQNLDSTAGLHGRARWQRDTTGDSLIVELSEWPMWGQLRLVTTLSPLPGDAVLGSDVGRWGHAPLAARRISCP